MSATTATPRMMVSLGMADDQAARPLVNPMQEMADGMPLLGVVLADEDRRGQPRDWTGPEAKGLDASKQHTHRRIQRHGQQGGNGHGQVLRVGKRLEQPALLVDQREDRHERDRNDQQREEHRRTHFHERIQAHAMEVALLAARLSTGRSCCTRSPPRRWHRPPARRWRSRSRPATSSSRSIP